MSVQFNRLVLWLGGPLVGLLLLLHPVWTLADAADDGPTLEVTDVPQLMAEARSLLKEYRESAALARYEQVLKLQPHHYEALWRAAILSDNIGKRYTDESRRGAYYASARQYADRAYAVNTRGGEANYAVAYSLARQATLLNAPKRLHLYKLMKKYVMRAVEYSPNMPEAWQMVGRWHYRMAHVNLVERAYYRLFLGGAPSGASNGKAIEALRKSLDLDPRRIEVYYDLARVYLNQDKDAEAQQILEAAAELEPVTSEELEISRHCQRLLTGLKRGKRAPRTL